MPRSRRKPARPGALADLSPARILAQIALLQFCYYGAAVILIVFVTLVAGQNPSASLLFNWENVRGDVTSGWTVALCWILVAVVTVIPLLLLVARSKLVPDFALTIHFLHLIVTSLFTRSFPWSMYWWIVQIMSSGIMISLGVWACQWRELQPLKFGGKSKDTEAQVNGHAVNDHTADEPGYEIGTQRLGPGRDGIGEYEMVTLPPKPEPS